MGHHKLRLDNECQNCGYTVDVAYCSKCGQQNTETRQSFHHLLTHFAEDLTHYDGAFWKTIKFLLLRPGKLTIEYIKGHRMRYVPPVKLYIFISFVTFFLMAIMAPDHNNTHSTDDHAEPKTITAIQENGISVVDENTEEAKKIQKYNGVSYKNLREFDSIHNSTPDDLKLPAITYHLQKSTMLFTERKPSNRDILIMIAHTIPKVLFIYMPIFAFLLWLVHGKRRWYFFDHGIFTLHYFSFLLMLITINSSLSWFTEYVINFSVSNAISAIMGTISLLYSFFYFFRAHSRFYGERKAISRLKSLLLFVINVICFFIAFMCTFVYMAYNLH